MKWKVEYRDDAYTVIDAKDARSAEIAVAYNVSSFIDRRIIDVYPIAINDEGEIFELREKVKVPDKELRTDCWYIAAIYEDIALCIQKDAVGNKIISEREVPCSILRKVHKL